MLATKTNTESFTLTMNQRITTALFAGTLGVFLLYGAAFANSDMLHNATHDTRHAIVAPCH